MTTVESKGTGRKDYSMNIEYIVEPTIRSYQQMYRYFAEWTDVDPYSVNPVDVAITSDTVTFVYDFRASTWANVLLGLKIEAIGTDGLVATIAQQTGDGSIYINIPAGFPFFKTIRYTVYNYSDKWLDVDVSMNGMYTSEKQYYLRVG